jgi:hypothetical protein
MEKGNEDCIKQLNNKDAGQEQLQVDNSPKDEEECKSEVERDAFGDDTEWGPRSVVVHTPAESAFMNVKRNRIDKVTRGNDKRAHIEEEVLEL